MPVLTVACPKMSVSNEKRTIEPGANPSLAYVL
jgi:hypothetical protein